MQADLDGHGAAGVQVDAVDGDACPPRQRPERGGDPREVGRLWRGRGNEGGGINDEEKIHYINTRYLYIWLSIQ